MQNLKLKFRRTKTMTNEIFYSDTLPEKYNPYIKKVNCVQCNNSFWIATEGNRKYCKKCARENNKISKRKNSKSPYYKRGTKYEHIVVYEEHYHITIPENMVIHHIDGNKKNNDINNLALMTRSAHSKLHRKLQLEGE